MGKQKWVAPIGTSMTKDGTALANSAALTDVSAAPQITIPAGALEVGDVIRVYAAGTFQVNATTPTLKLGVYWGGVAGVELASGNAITVVNTATVNWPFRLEAWITCRDEGPTGLAATTGYLMMPASLQQFQAPYAMDDAAFAAVTIDTTIAKALTVGALWGTAAVANTLTLRQLVVEGIGTLA